MTPNRGKNTKIHPGAIIYGEVEYGDNCKFQAGCILVPGVKIGSNVFIGPGVITTNDRNMDGGFQETIFKDGCSIGAGAMILAGGKKREKNKGGMGGGGFKKVSPHN